jgi:hypothetical protein
MDDFDLRLEVVLPTSAWSELYIIFTQNVFADWLSIVCPMFHFFVRSSRLLGHECLHVLIHMVLRVPCLSFACGDLNHLILLHTLLQGGTTLCIGLVQ